MDDDELRALLRGGDPAGSLPPADPARTARRLEDTMTDPHTPESRADGTRHRSRLTWIVAAAAVVLIAAGIGFVVAGGDDPSTVAGEESATAPPTSSSDPDPAEGSESGSESGSKSGSESGSEGAGESPSITELSLDATAVGARCAPPRPAAVAQQSVAVDAVVTSIAQGVVTLEPTRFYAGTETDQVVVREPSEDLQALLAAVDFEEGGRYLVSATGDRVSLCGLSAPWTADLAATYDAAFPS